MKFNKKAALNLSVQAIVILVIAFVVLGLALTLTRYIFGVAQEKAGRAIDIIELESKPTSDNPITIPKKVIIAKGDSKEMDIGVYNIKDTPYTSATLGIIRCIRTIGEDREVVEEDLPSMVTVEQTIESSDSAAYRAYLTENDKLTAGNYICIIAVYDSIAGSAEPYYTEQFSLVVTA
ncbi:hypothetical protein KY342_06140 [Candidatus Woesearchaeota archaeon]|nr:hypothetical protein [Candidatus Woesearchaeota archaeon]